MGKHLGEKLRWNIWLTFLYLPYLQDHDPSSPGSLGSFNLLYFVSFPFRFQKVQMSPLLVTKPSAGFSPSFPAWGKNRQMIWGESIAQNSRFTPKSLLYENLASQALAVSTASQFLQIVLLFFFFWYHCSFSCCLWPLHWSIKTI